MQKTLLLRIAGPGFCCGAVFEMEPPICTRAADKIEKIALHRGLEKVIRHCKNQAWDYEVITL